jgi:hypothetical protein|tara:strand:- start:515 stop:811 length:297 start_codon:yes stop_codon:yes gene_type:complete
MKDWEKWKNKFLRSWSNSMKWLACDEYTCWTRTSSQRYWNTYEPRVQKDTTLWRAVLFFRSKFPQQDIEIDVLSNTGYWVTVWVKPPVQPEPVQQSLF